MTIAFLFPGQGVQASVVCAYYKSLKNKDPEKTEKSIQILQKSLNQVNPEIKTDVLQILENESSLSWSQTSFVQPLTFTLSILSYQLIRDKNLIGESTSFMLGHSLGALSAICASGMINFEDGCKIATARGKFMQEESEKSDNGMCAIIGLAENAVREICRKTDSEIALINAPTAFVVGCQRKKFPQIEQEAARRGAAKTIRLGTPGAFHTKAMQDAYQKFKDFIGQYSLQKPQIPIVNNIKGIATLDPQEIKNDLVESMINPVNWIRMMNFLKKNKVDYYVECGPGTSLASLARMNGIEKEKILQI